MLRWTLAEVVDAEVDRERGRINIVMEVKQNGGPFAVGKTVGFKEQKQGDIEFKVRISGIE